MSVKDMIVAATESVGRLKAEIESARGAKSQNHADQALQYAAEHASKIEEALAKAAEEISLEQARTTGAEGEAEAKAD